MPQKPAADMENTVKENGEADLEILQKDHGARFLIQRRKHLLHQLWGCLSFQCFLPFLRIVPLKLLPFDNKNEFMIVLDMPEGTSLEKTDTAVTDFGDT